ncbi:MAG: LamG domain-containing protein [Deltaproteobacteria bacterium]|nr:LamG domain-containing protein [Deltaproteobacteria bacterium]
MRMRAVWVSIVLAGCTPLRALDETFEDARALDARTSDVGPLDARSFDAPRSDAPELDAPGFDAPGLDAPGLDAWAPDAFRATTDAPILDAPLFDAWRAPDTGGALIAWYPFDSTRDATGLGHTLVSTGVTFTGSIATLGASAMLSTPTATDLDEITAVSFWVRPSELGGGIGTRAFLVSRGDVLTLFLRFTALPRCTLAGGSVNGTEALVADVWTHLACVRDAATMTLYTNGVATGASTATTTPVPSSAELWLGQSSTGEDPLLGDLSDVRLYRRAPSAAEIAALAADRP